jgi:hypothetical protein
MERKKEKKDSPSGDGGDRGGASFEYYGRT